MFFFHGKTVIQYYFQGYECPHPISQSDWHFSLPFSQLHCHFTYIIGKTRPFVRNAASMRTISGVWSACRPSPQLHTSTEALGPIFELLQTLTRSFCKKQFYTHLWVFLLLPVQSIGSATSHGRVLVHLTLNEDAWDASDELAAKWGMRKAALPLI